MKSVERYSDTTMCGLLAVDTSRQLYSRQRPSSWFQLVLIPGIPLPLPPSSTHDSIQEQAGSPALCYRGHLGILS